MSEGLASGIGQARLGARVEGFALPPFLDARSLAIAIDLERHGERVGFLTVCNVYNVFLTLVTT